MMNSFGSGVQNSVSRRNVLKILGAAAMVPAISACSFGGSSSSNSPKRGLVKAAAPQKPVTIEFWRRNYAKGGVNADSVTTDAAIQAFHKRYPTITVVPKGDPSTPATNQKYDIAILQQKAGPDVFSTTGPELTKYARAGALALPDIPDSERADYDSAVLTASTVNGELAGFPLWVVPWFQFINLARFGEAGIAAPDDAWTYEQFLAAAEGLTGTRKNGNKGYGWGFYTTDYSFLLVDGARPLSADGKTWTFSSAEAASALEKWADVVKRGAAAPGAVSLAYPDSVNLFKTQAVGILQNPSALATELISSKDWTFEKNWDVVRSPSGDAPQATFAALGYLGVRAQDDSDKVAAAQLFSQYLTGPEVGRDLSSRDVQWWQAPAARRSARSDFASYHPAKAKIASFLDSVYVQPNVDKWTQIDSQFLGPARDSVLTGEKSAKEALDGIAAQAQKLVGRSQ